MTTTGLLVVYAKCIRATEEPGLGRVGGHRASPRDLRRGRAVGGGRLRAEGRMHPAHVAVGADVFEGHGRFGDKPEPSEARTGHILTHVLCNDPTREAEWDAWYDDEHVPDMLSCGTFGAMSRWHRSRPVRVGSNHLTLYDVSTPTVDEAVRRSAVTLAEIVADGRKHETHAGALTVTLRPTGNHGGGEFRRGTS